MNKQEAIEKLKEESWECDDIYVGVTPVIDLDDAQEIISKIDEPQKVVVPKFVADWIESQKESFSDASAIDMYDNLTLDNNGGYYHEVWLWVIDHHYDFTKAWHDGYEVEKEPLYTVEIPNPNLNTHTILQKIWKGLALIMVTNARWKGWESSKLTESEIKEDFEWAWPFAREVEK